MTKQLYGIIGHPISHSLSPAMQNAAFQSSGIDAEYRLFDLLPEALEDFLNALPNKGISGLNVTSPHKIAAKDYIETNGSLDETAKRLGAINTIKVIDGKPNGYNTDGPGFYRSLVEDLRFEPEGKNVFLLGAGGAARAITMYLGNGPKTISVSDIDPEKCSALKAHFEKYYDGKRLHIVKKDDYEKALANAELLINATPLGMKESDGSPMDRNLLHPGLYVYDLVYNRPATELVKEATQLKLHAVTGAGMLLYQGAISFEIWTGKKPPIDVMKKALREALKQRV